DSGDQEDEHSCFSDNTHRDMVGDCIGIQNVYEGRYQRLDGTMVMGTSVYDIVAQVDMALADRLRTEIAASVTAAEALQPPFDQEIASGNTAGNDRVRALITALRTQEATLQEVFAAFGLTVEIPE
ncbi:MAG: imelysin family protein, partial [Myxococcota bacterium]